MSSCYCTPEVRDREWAELRREDEEPETGEGMMLQPYVAAWKARLQGAGSACVGRP
jgi:hypothetical protein